MQNVIAIFDIGKTNKKLLVFDEAYRLLSEETQRIPETKDEDGDACDNLEAIKYFMFDALRKLVNSKQYQLKALNFTTYGASFVYLDYRGTALTPLYNYLKPYPENLLSRFYDKYGGKNGFAAATASPVLGSLNSGMQLYRLCNERPALWSSVKYALHLPQYLSFLFTKKLCTDITSLGCHTNLWHFENDEYHEWVEQENILPKLAPMASHNKTLPAEFEGYEFAAGIGLHDSSAALIPYLMTEKAPFILISTGTWCITLNPFNQEPLTIEQLDNDCLCYLQYNGKPVKASRLFLGQMHEDGVKAITEYFGTSPAKYAAMPANSEVLKALQELSHSEDFDASNLSSYPDDDYAYHALLYSLVKKQEASTRLVMNQDATGRILVDGGFGKNTIFMQLVAMAFAPIPVYGASMAQATALGAALVMHNAWNKHPVPYDIIAVKHFEAPAIRVI